jgi:4-amino-4-deoxy-L-arabinose transferase-like glycosyltransferase
MSTSRLPWLLAVIGVFLLLLVVVPGYYVVHKPFYGVERLASPVVSGGLAEVGMALLNLLLDAVLLALTLAAAAAWGSRIFRWLDIRSISGLERWTLGAVLGLGLLGILVFALALVGALYRWVGYALLLALGITALPEIRRLVGWFSRVIRRMRPTRIPWLWLFTGSIGVLTLGLALLPPTGWDALVYHLQGPRLYLEAHRLVAVPENLYLNWPAQVEMLFTWGMLLKDDTLAKLLNWALWLLVAAMIYALGRRTMNERVGEWAMALWAAVPLAAGLAGVAYVDLGLTAFVLAAFYAFMRWSESQHDGCLIVSALLAGFAMATKYTAVTWAGLLILLFVYYAWRHQRRRAGWILIRAVLFAVVAGLVVLPWLIKNWVVTGNPVYPFLFGGVGWNAIREAWLYWPGQSYSQNLLDYLALPWLMTVLGTAATPAFDATIGPLLLCLVPLAFLFRGRPRAVNYGLVLVAAQYALFAVTIWRYLYLAQSRLVLAIFPFLCLAAAYAFVNLSLWDRSQFRLSWTVGVVVTLVIVVTLLTGVHAFLAQRPLAQLIGLEADQDYLGRKLGYHVVAMRFTNDDLPAESRTMYMWEPRAYHGQSQALADPTLDNLSQLRVRHGDAGQALTALRANGFTHFLLQRSGLEFLQLPQGRAPTLGSLVGNPPQDEELYPLTDSDLVFLQALIDQSQQIADLGGAYEIYQLP